MIKVAERNGTSFAPCGEDSARVKSRVAIPEQDCHAKPAVVCQHDVSVAVTIEVTERHSEGQRAGPNMVVNRGREGAVTVPDKDADKIARSTRDNNIESSIVIQIADRE